MRSARFGALNCGAAIKDANEQWQSETFAAPEDIVEFRAIDCQLELREVYRRIDFDAS